MPKMNPEVKAKWVAALRSGEYVQGTNWLRQSHSSYGTYGEVREQFCCLGVLCNIHAQEHPEIAVTQTDPCVYLGATQELPKEVTQWAGLDANDPIITRETGHPAYISHLNDQAGWSFSRIADAIEKQL